MRLVDPDDPHAFDDFTDDEFIEWSENFIRVVSAQPEAFGLTLQDAEEVSHALTTFQRDATKARQAQRRLEEAETELGEAARRMAEAERKLGLRPN